MNENLLVTLVLILCFSPVIYELIIAIRLSAKGEKISFRKFKKFAKFSFLIVSLIAIGFALISHTNYLDYRKPLTFDEFDRITFDDFRGLEFFKKSLYGNERFAYVVSTIESEIGDNSVTVESYFHPSRSFVYNKNSNSKELLSHEKYHIKVTELFARKAKQSISTLETFDRKQIEEIIKSTKIEKNKYQREYDFQTFHSYVFSEQKKYEQEIDSLLDALSEFKNPKITFDEKH